MDKEEQYTVNEGFYLSRINEYHERNRLSKEETNDILEYLIGRKDKLEQQQAKDKLKAEELASGQTKSSK